MSKQRAMDYCRLNLQRCALKPDAEDREKIDQMKEYFRIMKSANEASVTFEKDSIDKIFHFHSMGLLCWAVVCVSLVGMFLSEYLEAGTYIINEEVFWTAYILPAILLGIRVYVGFGTFALFNLAHIALAAVCALLTFLQIRIFGSEINWAWVFVVVGTVLTVVIRALEYKKELGPNLKWRSEMREKIQAGEQAVEDAARVFASIGSAAEQQLNSQFPGAKLPERNNWFAFPRNDTDSTPKTEVIKEVNTDFETRKSDYRRVIRDTQSTTYRFAVITEQTLDFEQIDRETAMWYIREKKMASFFGMSEPADMDDLCYMAYVHRWSESQHDVVHVDYDAVDYKYTGERTKAKREMEDEEWSKLGMDAESFMLRTDSLAASEAARQYLSRKESKLNSIYDYEARERHVEYDQEIDRNADYEHIANISVVTSDGELVALYCADNRQALAMSEKMAKDYWDAGITHGAVPQSPAQAAYLYQQYLA